MRRDALALILTLHAGCAEQLFREDVDASRPGADVTSAQDASVAPPDAVDAGDTRDVMNPVMDAPRADVFDAPATGDDVVRADLPATTDTLPADLPDVTMDAPGDQPAPPRDVVDVIAAQDVPRDTGVRPDVPATGGCVSGARGTYVARFRWTGSGSGSRASVSYEANTLPDRSRWRAGAYSRSGVGYNPVFGDPFLGEGGLDMGSTVFMHVELSTAGISSLRRVTLAVYGRSYSTGSSGSFSWLSGDGSGEAPSGSVANSAPYRWYAADATAAFRAGNSGVLLRISPGPPSGTLVVNRIELCFDAD